MNTHKDPVIAQLTADYTAIFAEKSKVYFSIAANLAQASLAYNEENPGKSVEAFYKDTAKEIGQSAAVVEKLYRLSQLDAASRAWLQAHPLVSGDLTLLTRVVMKDAFTRARAFKAYKAGGPQAFKKVLKSL